MVVCKSRRIRLCNTATRSTVSTRQPDYDQVAQWKKSISDDSAYFVQILCNERHTSTVHETVPTYSHLLVYAYMYMYSSVPVHLHVVLPIYIYTVQYMYVPYMYT